MPGGADAGIIDKDVETPEMAQGGGDHALAVVGRSDVGTNGFQGAARGAGLGRELLEQFFRAGRGQDPYTAGCRRQRQGLSNPLRCPGNQHARAGQCASLSHRLLLRHG